jgi:hypothetical protein
VITAEFVPLGDGGRLKLKAMLRDENYSDAISFKKNTIIVEAVIIS